MDITASARSRVRENRRRYDELVALTRAHAGRGDVERVLLTATIAANHAYNAQIGVLADPALERLVTEAVRVDGAVRIDAGRTAGRVLHVLTEGYPIGGHTRLAWRWMTRDPRRPDVALTMQDDAVPEKLREVAEERGGRAYDLAKAFPTFTARAAALRRLMDQADLVVLHVHPYDTVALAAASLPGPRPPIVFENHADHVFWLGLACADLVVDNRPAAGRLCRELRSVPPQRLATLPLPIDPAARASSRKTVRGKLGLRPDQVAALTVANYKKVSPLWGRGFDWLLTQALTTFPELVVFLAGPDEGPWRALQSAFPGRFFPLGVVPDTGLLFRGMDLYLDSFPVSGGTSILEAAAAGLPPLSLQPPGPHEDVYAANPPGLVTSGHAATSVEQYLASLEVLVRNPRGREERSESVRRGVLATHSGPSWEENLESVYERARKVGAADLAEYPAATAEDVDYAASLLPLMMNGDGTPDPLVFCEPLGAQLDARLRFDLYIAVAQRQGRSLCVRVSRGWEDHPAWTMRLVALAKQHPRLSVSFPFVAGDDGSGARSAAALEPVLAANGDTPETCGDLSLDVRAPTVTGPSVTGELALDAAALDGLELLLGSVAWADDEGAEAAGTLR